MTVPTSTLEQRVQALEDERAILQTLHSYGQSIDYGDEDEFLNCWTQDARLTFDFATANGLGAGDREDMSFLGRDQIAGFFRQDTHAPERYHKHFMAVPRIAIDGDRATVECYFARVDARPDGPILTSFGRYLDELVRCVDGHWRFASRRGEVENRISGPDR